MLTRLRDSRAVGLVRYHLYRDVLLAWPKRHACNICGWRGRRFLTYLHKFVLCPQCGSQIRHRLIAGALSWLPAPSQTRVDGARVLHISPEYCLGLVFRSRARHYVRADYAADDCDLKQDITRMPFSPDTFDVVICCDVLEHVPEDRLAVAEIHRVLRPGGVAILTVPQSDDAVETSEDVHTVTPEAREREYGQIDHVRNYGSDFEQRVASAGFRVSCASARSFAPDVVLRYVLKPPVRLTASWGWNDRRVYFATKIAPAPEDAR